MHDDAIGVIVESLIVTNCIREEQQEELGIKDCHDKVEENYEVLRANVFIYDVYLIMVAVVQMRSSLRCQYC